MLDKLRRGVESHSTHRDGTTWGSVYVANYVRGRSDAAVLGALKRAGYYLPYDGGERMYEDVWGSVKL